MIATVSPVATDVEHTLNTLRYAFRVKGLSTESVMPSKERNAPRVMSVAPKPQTSRVLEPIADRSAEKPRRERKHKRLPPLPGLEPAALEAMESKVTADITDLRHEMKCLAKAKKNDEATINALKQSNEEMLKKMARMETLMANFANSPTASNASGGGMWVRDQPGSASKKQHRLLPLGPVSASPRDVAASGSRSPDGEFIVTESANENVD
jgi:hypothetical protein